MFVVRKKERRKVSVSERERERERNCMGRPLGRPRARKGPRSQSGLVGVSPSPAARDSRELAVPIVMHDVAVGRGDDSRAEGGQERRRVGAGGHVFGEDDDQIACGESLLKITKCATACLLAGLPLGPCHTIDRGRE